MKTYIEIFLMALIGALIISYISYKVGQHNIIDAIQSNASITVNNKHIICVTRDSNQLIYVRKPK